MTSHRARGALGPKPRSPLFWTKEKGRSEAMSRTTVDEQSTRARPDLGRTTSSRPLTASRKMYIFPPNHDRLLEQGGVKRLHTSSHAHRPAAGLRRRFRLVLLHYVKRRLARAGRAATPSRRCGTRGESPASPLQRTVFREFPSRAGMPLGRAPTRCALS